MLMTIGIIALIAVVVGFIGVSLFDAFRPDPSTRQTPRGEQRDPATCDHEWKGDMCLFKPDDPEALGGRVKLRPGPGVVDVEGATLRLTVKGENGSYAWELVEAIADPEEERAFLDFAAANDRIIGHLLDGARFYEQG